jgi:beta-phosphoglucomutase-like phosphatase (HAD superfamily)
LKFDPWIIKINMLAARLSSGEVERGAGLCSSGGRAEQAMIRAFLFDLDGTLVQTEKMKALSYAQAVQRLRGLPQPDERAVTAYREIVGASREAASRHIMARLELEPELRPLIPQYDASEPWQVLAAMRLAIYSGMVADPQVLRENQWPHTVNVLRRAREMGCATALVTMSKHSEVMHVLDALDIAELVDLIITADDIRQGKPDPEGYLLAAERLHVTPGECLVLEDSVNGVRAARPS